MNNNGCLALLIAASLNLLVACNQQPQIASTADLSVQYQAALTLPEPSKTNELKKLAKQGHAESYFNLAEQASSASNRVFYLQKAANLAHKAAILQLAQMSMQGQHVHKATHWLQQASEFDLSVNLYLAEQYFKAAEKQKTLKHLTLASELKSNQDPHFVQAYAQATSASQLAIDRQPCNIQLQAVVKNLSGLWRVLQLQQKFAADQRLQGLAICMNTPLLVKQPLECSDQAKQRLSCNLADLDGQLRNTDFSHLLLMADSGKANVHNGIMYLDVQDDYDVFVHELAHFAGFVDEYPLSAQLAQMHCEGENAPNLRFTKADNAKSATGLSKARTCDNHPIQAYKLSDKITFLEYHDSAYIPKSYLKIWQWQLNNKADLIPAYENLAQLFETMHASEQAQYWRNRQIHYNEPICRESP